MSISTDTLSRRQFIAAAGVTGGLVGLAAGASQALAEEAAPAESSDNAWDVACDVLVIGMGGAGAVAAISAADEGAQVLLVEKAPEYLEGGNTRYSEQVMVTWENEQDGFDFLSAMGEGRLDMTDEVLQFMAHETIESKTWFEEHGAELVAHARKFDSYEQLEERFGAIPAVDISKSNWAGEQPDGTWSYEEYPVWPNGEKCNYRVNHTTLVSGPSQHKNHWEFLRATVESYSDSIACWFNSPATQLIRDKETGVVLGAVVDHNGEPTNVFARNGVILSCGSFEADPAKVETYTQRLGHTFVGTSYNTGDAIDMAGAIGAQMWHMGTVAGPYIGAIQPNAGRIWWYTTSAIRATSNGHSIYVTSQGKRFMPECGYNHHGHVAVGDTWQNQ